MVGKIVKIVLNTILVLLLLCGLLAALSVLPFSKEYLNVYTVQSGSMEPAIHTGSLIFTRKKDDYKEGDIVTRITADPKITVTHRIIRKEQNEQGKTVFITKGDANDGEDREVVTEEGIIGKVYLTIPYLGYPVSYSKTPQGFILVIVIPAVIIVYEELQKIQAEIRKKFDYRKRMKKKKETLEKKNGDDENNKKNSDKKDEEKKL